MNSSGDPSGGAASSPRKRLLMAVLIAALSSAALGGLWSVLGLPGGPGPVFGLVFAMVFVFGGGLGALGAGPRGPR